MDGVVRAKRHVRIPEVMSPQQVMALLRGLKGTHQLMARLLHGTGMRLMEAIRLRVRDINFEYRQITVRSGKGGKDRVTVLPDSLTSAPFTAPAHPCTRCIGTSMYGTGTAGTQRRKDHHDLHACVAARRTRGAQPVGPDGIAVARRHDALKDVFEKITSN